MCPSRRNLLVAEIEYSDGCSSLSNINASNAASRSCDFSVSELSLAAVLLNASESL